MPEPQDCDVAPADLAGSSTDGAPSSCATWLAGLSAKQLRALGRLYEGVLGSSLPTDEQQSESAGEATKAARAA